MVESFEQACTLERRALQAMLEHGRPEQRVWAIWALAMRSHDGASLGRRVEREPDPGVRRTLAVLLAGHGDTDLLVALARHDPDLAVRASASQLVTRLAAGGMVDQAIVLDAGEREPAIQIAVLGAIGRGAPEFLVALALHKLAAREPDVQFEAFEALLRIDTHPARDAACSWMLRQPDVTIACDRWLRAAGVDSLAEAFEASAASVRASVLVRLRAPPWSAVQRLIGDDVQQLRAVLSRTDIVMPARVLARAITSGLHHGFIERLTAQLHTAARGRALIADIRRAIEHHDDDDRQLRVLAGRAKGYAEALEIRDGADVLDDVAAHHPVEQLFGLENAIARWLAEVDAPAELVPLLPELHRYCTRVLAELDRVRSRGRPRFERAQLADPNNPGGAYQAPWDEQARFRELVAALERLVRSGD